jgi:hypothetical protein
MFVIAHILHGFKIAAGAQALKKLFDIFRAIVF